MTINNIRHGKSKTIVPSGAQGKPFLAWAQMALLTSKGAEAEPQKSKLLRYRVRSHNVK